MRTGSKLIYGQQHRVKPFACKSSIIGPSYQVRIPWQIEPQCLRKIGDPTDTSIKLRPLEPASGQALARDLVLKTRRRKGLGDQIAVSKYLDDEFVVCNAMIPFFFPFEFKFALYSWLYLRRDTLTYLVKSIICIVVYLNNI